MKWKKLGILFSTLILTAVAEASVSAVEYTDEEAGAWDEYAWLQVDMCRCGKIVSMPNSIDYYTHQNEVVQQTGWHGGNHNGHGTTHIYQTIHHNADSYGESEAEVAATEEVYLGAEVDEKEAAASFVDKNGLTWEVENGVLTVSGNGVLEPLWIEEASTFIFQKADATSLVIKEGITEIGDKAFADCFNLQSVVIPNSVIKIGDSAFEFCKNITEIDIPDQVTEIGESAFERSGLTSISLPSGITEIKKGTFWNCRSLTEILIPDSVKKIGEEAFFGCQMSELAIPDSVTEIGNGAFSYCDKLARITIPHGVKIINGLTFCVCTSLAELTISNGVTEIGPGAFLGCDSLTEVTIPDSVKRVGCEAFVSCDKLKSVTFEGDAPQVIKAPQQISDSDYYGYDKSPLKERPFNWVVTVYYPSGNKTYTEEIKAEYGLYLNWEEKKAVDTQLPFVDVDSDSWFSEPVEYVYKHGIMTGLDTTHFGPTVKVSRAQVAAILHRMEGEPAIGYDSTAFKDVADGMFYTSAAMWAKKTGVIAGYDNGNFGPADNITREQMSVILFRYAQYKGFDTTATDNLSKFPDKNKVSSFAKEGISWAVGTGLITGDQGNISPQGYAERAQAAAILQRFMTAYRE